MQVGFNLTNLFRYARVNPTANPGATYTPPTIQPQHIAQSSLNDRRVARLDATLNELNDLLTRSKLRTRLGRATAISSASLKLSNDGTATTFNSVEQVNTATTSYTPFGPTFTGSGLSTALPELTGVYDGSDGTDTLQFEVTRAGVHGESRIDIKVYNSAGDRLKTIRIQPWHALDREYSVGNGLQFTLGAGALIKNDEFYLDVFATTPSAVDPDKPFDGTRNDRPNFDPGQSVTAGTFAVNGIDITVNANDTINTVLARINAADAGVDAVYDTGTDSVRLTQRETGSAHDIVLGTDTSGFLAATKLTGAATPGLDSEAFVPLSSSTRFGTVSAGTLHVNGGPIAFDPTVDSLADLVQRINDTDNGVTASLINDNQRVLLRHEYEGAPLVIDDGDTGFFDAALVAEKAYKARTRTGFSRGRTYEIADQVEQASSLVNEVFDPRANPSSDSPALAALRESIVTALRGNAPEGETRFGLSFALDAPVRAQFVTVDRRELTGSQRRNASGAQQFFQGLALSLRGALGAYQNRYGLATSGILLNTTA